MPVPVYGAVPPVALTTTVVVPPLHNIVPAVELADARCDLQSELLA